METLRCTFCGGTLAIVGGAPFGKCDYCGHSVSLLNARDMAKATDEQAENVVKCRKELLRNLDVQERSQKKRDYSSVKYFALEILKALPGDFTAAYFAALADHKSGNDAPYLDFLRSPDLSRASEDDIELVTDKIILNIEKKHEAPAREYLSGLYGKSAQKYLQRLDAALAEYKERMRLAGVRDCDVFLCHSSADEAEATALCGILEDAGLTCWIAERNLLAGTQNYEEELVQAVQHCRMLLLLSSANSIYSKECEKEVRIANAEGKLFFSVKADNENYIGTIKNVFRTVQWLNAYDGVENHAEEIVSAVKLAFAEDEEERAEMERRALEAKKQRAAAQKTVINNNTTIINGAGPSAAPKGDNSEVFITQIRACTGSYKDFNMQKAEQLVDRGLESNPDSAAMWYWKHLLEMYKKYPGVTDQSCAYCDFIDHDLRAVKNKSWDAPSNRFVAGMREIPAVADAPEFNKSAATSALNSVQSDYGDYVSRAAYFPEWKESHPQLDLEKYMITDILWRLGEDGATCDNPYYSQALNKIAPDDDLLDRHLKKVQDEIDYHLKKDTKGYTEQFNKRNKPILNKLRKQLDELDAANKTGREKQLDKQIAELKWDKDIAAKDIADNDRLVQKDVESENSRHERKVAELQKSIADYDAALKRGGRRNAGAFFGNIFLLLYNAVKLVVLCVVTVVAVFFVVFGTFFFMASFTKDICAGIWSGKKFKFIKTFKGGGITRARNNKQDELRQEEAEHSKKLKELADGAPNRLAKRKKELEELDKSLAELEAYRQAGLQADILKTAKDIEHNRRLLDECFLAIK